MPGGSNNSIYFAMIIYSSLYLECNDFESENCLIVTMMSTNQHYFQQTISFYWQVHIAHDDDDSIAIDSLNVINIIIMIYY